MTTQASTAPRSLLAGLAARLADGLAALAAVAPAARCAQEAERLYALSDEELARRGLTRDRVAHHAFRRFMDV
jgi:hypothetical protein